MEDALLTWLNGRLLLEEKTKSTRHPTPAVNHQPVQNAAQAAHNPARLACRREQQADPFRSNPFRAESPPRSYTPAHIHWLHEKLLPLAM